MNVWIKINTDNAAFEDFESGETARILRAMADSIEENHHFSPGFDIPARDSNGNEVGFLTCYDSDKDLILEARK